MQRAPLLQRHHVICCVTYLASVSVSFAKIRKLKLKGPVSILCAHSYTPWYSVSYRAEECIKIEQNYIADLTFRSAERPTKSTLHDCLIDTANPQLPYH